MFDKRMLVSFLLVVSLVASGLVGYVMGYRASTADHNQETTILYANLLGERLLELNAIGDKVGSKDLDEILEQEKESFVLIVGCGKWLDDLKNVPSSDLPEFEDAVELATNSLGMVDKDNLSECLARIEGRHK